MEVVEGKPRKPAHQQKTQKVRLPKSDEVIYQEEHQSSIQCERQGEGVGYTCCIFWHTHFSAPGEVWGCASQGEGVAYTFCVVLFGRDVRSPSVQCWQGAVMAHTARGTVTQAI